MKTTVKPVATNKPKVTAYVPHEVLEALEQRIQDSGRTISAEVAYCLELILGPYMTGLEERLRKAAIKERREPDQQMVVFLEEALAAWEAENDSAS